MFSELFNLKDVFLQENGIIKTHEDGWMLVWLLPLAILVPAVLVFLFLVSTKRIPSDEIGKD